MVHALMSAGPEKAQATTGFLTSHLVTRGILLLSICSDQSPWKGSVP